MDLETKQDYANFDGVQLNNMSNFLFFKINRVLNNI